MFPQLSDASKQTVTLVPVGKKSPCAGPIVCTGKFTPFGQVAEGKGGIQFAIAPPSPALPCKITSSGQERLNVTGVGLTVTVKSQVSNPPQPSSKLKVFTVVPRGKALPFGKPAISSISTPF